MTDFQSLVAQKIAEGSVVAFPTDTFYALSCSALSEQAVRRIYAIKRRPLTEPLPVFIAGIDKLPSVASSVSANTLLLGRQFWPGALTLLVDRARRVPRIVSAGQPTLAVRVPQHDTALSILSAANVPCIATSANISGSAPAKTAREVWQSLGEQVDIIVTGECGDFDAPSTIVDARSDTMQIVRQGAIAEQTLRQTLTDEGK